MEQQHSPTTQRSNDDQTPPLGTLLNTLESAYGAMTYEQNVIPKLIKWYHATAGFPATSIWLRAINDDFYSSWPGLTTRRVQKYLGKIEETTYGHLELIRQVHFSFAIRFIFNLLVWEL